MITGKLATENVLVCTRLTHSFATYEHQTTALTVFVENAHELIYEYDDVTLWIHTVVLKLVNELTLKPVLKLSWKIE